MEIKDKMKMVRKKRKMKRAVINLARKLRRREAGSLKYNNNKLRLIIKRGVGSQSHS